MDTERATGLILEVRATDYHTAGEPFRIVEHFADLIPGATVRELRQNASGSPDLEHVRRMLCHEPRGHADMYGGFIVSPDDSGADFGVLFWHKDGYSTACGHGTIALGAWAVETGRVPAPHDGAVDVTIDVPSGRVTARVHLRAGTVESVAFLNVPARVIARDFATGGLRVDVAWGGAIYAFVEAHGLGLSVTPENLPALIEAGRDIKAGLEGTEVSRHWDDERLSGIYGTVIWEEIEPLHYRNVVIFTDGEVDRSPTGSATSARTVLLAESGLLDDGQVWRNESIVGTGFRARAVGTTPEGLLTEVVGSAFRTGEHVFTLDPRDPLGPGFVLR